MAAVPPQTKKDQNKRGGEKGNRGGLLGGHERRSSRKRRTDTAKVRRSRKSWLAAASTARAQLRANKPPSRAESAPTATTDGRWKEPGAYGWGSRNRGRRHRLPRPAETSGGVRTRRLAAGKGGRVSPGQGAGEGVANRPLPEGSRAGVRGGGRGLRQGQRGRRFGAITVKRGSATRAWTRPLCATKARSKRFAGAHPFRANGSHEASGPRLSGGCHMVHGN